MGSSLYNIEKLDEANYDSWSFTMKAVLVHQECWDVVSGSSKKPEKDNESWVKKDEKALATIILSVTARQISYIKACKTSAEAWNTLKDVHRPKGPVRKVTLFKQLLGMRMGEGECVQQHVCKFAAISDKLAETGIELQEELFVIMLLASLPKSFENFVVALETRDELPSLSALKIKLAEEGERRKANGSSDVVAAENAFVSHSKKEHPRKFYRNNNKESPRKFHTGSNNNNNGRSNKNVHNNNKNGKCYSCGRQGHFAAQCNNNKGKMSANAHTQSFSVLASTNENNNNNVLNSSVWCVDSGATTHLCCDRGMFTKFIDHHEEINLAGENKITARGKGSVFLEECNVMLNNVLYVPELQCNFISVGRVANKAAVKFNGKGARVIDAKGKTVLYAKRVGDLFLYTTSKKKSFFMNSNEALKWHYRYGHLNLNSLKKLVDEKLVHGMKVNFPKEINCKVCMKSKCTAKPFTQSESRATDLLELVHTDLCGPINKQSIVGSRYLLTFIDDMSRYVFVYFLKSKDETFEKFKEFKEMVERQTGRKIKCLRSDNGTEFVNNHFNTYLKEHGIVRQLTVPHTPQQNGVAERFNRTLVEMARSMLVAANLDESLWAEAGQKR